MGLRPDTSVGYTLFHDSTRALAAVEAAGIRIDMDYMAKTTAKLEKDILEREKKLKSSKFFKTWKKLFGDKAKLDSTTQLEAVLKEKGLKTGIETATKRMSVAEASLSKIDHPFIKPYLEMKKDKKVLSTYMKGIAREVDSKGFLHPSYKLASGDDEKGGAASYRGSCSDPNQQNIPKRNDRMKQLVRPLFIARKGRHLVEIDFSGIEVRIAACYTKDKNLIAYLNDKGDMHRDKARELFLLKESEVNKKTTRDASKNMFVFPEFYGSKFWQCAPPIWEAMEKRDFRVGENGITIREHLKKHGIKELGNCDVEFIRDNGTQKGTFVHHVKQVEEIMWDKTFPQYDQWKKDWYEQYTKRGWFQLKTGFICSGIYKRNQVLNYPIQGSAFHCLLWCLCEAHKEIRLHKWQSLIVGQIHDSIICDVVPAELNEFLDVMKDIMSVRLPKYYDWINVPITTEVEVAPIGGNWNNTREYKRNKKGVWLAV